jgi:drug/metabolite transporter (DMT)-like permease
MQAKSADHLTYTAFVVMVLFGGLNAIGIRYVVSELPPFWGATLRFAPASLLLFLLVLLQRLPLPRGRALLGTVIFGALQFGLGFAFAFWSLRTLSPGMVMVILSLTPLLTLLFAILHRQERFRWQVLAGSLISMGGIVVIFLHQMRMEISLLPLIAIFLNAACAAEASVIIKGFPKSHPVTTNAIGMAAGTVILLSASLLWQEPHPLPAQPATWLALVYLILIGSCLVFILMLYVLKRWTASATAYTFVLLPFVTVLASAFLGQEQITPNFLLGGVLLLLGVYIGALRKPKQVEDVPLPPLTQEFDMPVTSPGC